MPGPKVQTDTAELKALQAEIMARTATNLEKRYNEENNATNAQRAADCALVITKYMMGKQEKAAPARFANPENAAQLTNLEKEQSTCASR